MLQTCAILSSNPGQRCPTVAGGHLNGPYYASLLPRCRKLTILNQRDTAVLLSAPGTRCLSRRPGDDAGRLRRGRLLAAQTDGSRGPPSRVRTIASIEGRAGRTNAPALFFGQRGAVSLDTGARCLLDRLLAVNNLGCHFASKDVTLDVIAQWRPRHAGGCS